MSMPGERPDEQEIAVGLAQAVVRALEPGAGALELKAARDVSQILVLDGLDRVLKYFEPHLGRELPTELAAVRDRLMRMAMRAFESGDILEFRVTGPELEALAGDLGALEWSSAGALGREVATVTAARVLEDLPVSGEDAASRSTRLTAPVAARLRAALDWLAGPRGFSQPIVVRSDDSLFEVSCANVDPSGLHPARHMLAEVDGLIGPALSGRSGWVVRVPAVAARDHFLMIERGGLRLALPWHAVLRLNVLASATIESRAAEADVALIDPLPFASPASRERPVVTVGHGARRAWLAADRLVWRLAAMPAEPDDGMRAAGLDRAVRTEEGELYAIAPLARWLEGVPEPAWPIERPMPTLPTASVTAIDAAPAQPVAVEPAPVHEMPAPPAPDVQHEAVMEFAPLPAETTVIIETTVVEVERVEVAVMPAPAPRMSRPIRIETDIIAPEPRPAAVAPPAPFASPPFATAPPTARPAPQAAPAAEARLPLLSLLHVEPLHAPVEAPAPARTAPPRVTEAPRPAAPAPTHASAATRRALVAEDSLMARIFLTKLLEQCGLAVTAVARAAELDAALRAGVWSLILADVELPDARGEAFVSALRARALEAEDTPLIALVRDREDRAVAEAAGVMLQLRKPIEPGALRGLLRSLSLLAPEPA